MPEERVSPFRYLPLILLVLALQTSAIYYVLDRTIPRPQRETAKDAKEEAPTKEQIVSQHPLIVQGIDPVTVNPAQDELGHLVKVAVQLGVDSPAARLEVEANKARVQDSLTRVLVPRTLERLRADSWNELREDIRSELNKWLGGRVVEVYFTKFVIQ